jgi:hypothetical protein
MITMRVAKHVFFVCLLLLISSCKSQQLKLEGYFESSEKGYNSVGRDYFFFKGDSFQLLRITDVEDGYGIGKFKIEEDSIELTFKSVGLDPKVTIEARKTVVVDSVFIDVEIIDQRTKAGMPHAGVLIVSKKKGDVADKYGFAKMRVHRNQVVENDTLKVFFVGYSDQYIPLNVAVSNHFKIRVELSSGYSYFEEADFLKYKIIRAGDEFSLFIFGNEVPFKRTTKVKFNRALRTFNDLVEEAKR